jgi:hypothetical protein
MFVVRGGMVCVEPTQLKLLSLNGNDWFSQKDQHYPEALKTVAKTQRSQR